MEQMWFSPLNFSSRRDVRMKDQHRLADCFLLEALLYCAILFNRCFYGLRVLVALPWCLVLIGATNPVGPWLPVIAEVPEFQTLVPFIQQTRGTMLSAVDVYNRPMVAAPEWDVSEHFGTKLSQDMTGMGPAYGYSSAGNGTHMTNCEMYGKHWETMGSPGGIEHYEWYYEVNKPALCSLKPFETWHLLRLDTSTSEAVQNRIQLLVSQKPCGVAWLLKPMPFANTACGLHLAPLASWVNHSLQPNVTRWQGLRGGAWTRCYVGKVFFWVGVDWSSGGVMVKDLKPQDLLMGWGVCTVTYL